MAINENEEFEFRARAEQEKKKSGFGDYLRAGQKIAMETIGKGWDALKIPEQMSRQGLGQLAGMVPQGKVTGNLPMDILRGTPKIEAETLAETAPGFVSRGSILAAGAAPVIKGTLKAAAPIGRGIASGLEDWAGIKPTGSLAEAFKDPSLIFSKGKEAAKPLYEAESGSGIFKGMYKPEEIVDRAKMVIKKGYKLKPNEGLTYRKAVDSLLKSGRYVKDELFAMRDEANSLVKESENLSQADKLHKRGLMASGLRSILPKNVGGRSSPFKVGEAMALSHFGPLGKVASLLFSPMALGVGSTGLGVAGKLASNPRAAMTIQQLLQRFGNENPNPQQ